MRRVVVVYVSRFHDNISNPDQILPQLGVWQRILRMLRDELYSKYYMQTKRQTHIVHALASPILHSCCV